MGIIFLLKKNSFTISSTDDTRSPRHTDGLRPPQIKVEPPSTQQGRRLGQASLANTELRLVVCAVMEPRPTWSLICHRKLAVKHPGKSAYVPPHRTGGAAAHWPNP